MCSDADSSLISVILPVRNGQRLLGRAIESVMTQRLPQGWSLELIIIDDASTDATAEVIKSCLEKSDSRPNAIRVITHTDNRGAAASQIEGIREARGRLLARIDHDDIFPEGYLWSLLDTALRSGADISVAPIEMVSSEGKVIKRVGFASESFTAERADLNRMKLDTACFSLCNKLIRREAACGTELPRGLAGLNCWDDVWILTNILLKGNVTVATTKNAVVYRYTVDKKSDSLTHSDGLRIMADRIRCTEELLKLIESKGLTEQFAPFVSQMKLRAKVNYLRSKQLKVSEWKKIFPMSATEIMRAPHFALPYRLGMALLQTVLPTK